MSEPKRADAVKLVASILLAEKGLLREVMEVLSSQYGRADYISALMPFSYTKYYCREMGENLGSCFVSFEPLIRPESLPDIKLRTNDIEKMFSRTEKRRVNIDPGYLSLAHLILATCKGYAHRPYLRDGVYADLTLIFNEGTFQTLPWTYPDYGEKKTIEMYKKIREKYKAVLING